VADGLDVVVLAHRLRSDRFPAGGQDVRAQHRRGGRSLRGERRDPLDRLLVDPMTGGMELLEFADDIDEFLDPLGTARGLDLIGPHVDVEVVEAAFEGTQVRFPGPEEFDEVDGVGDDEADGVWGVRTGVSVGCVRVGGIHRVRGWVGDVQNVPLHAGGRTVTGGAWVCSHLSPLSHQRPNEFWVMTRPADPAEEERRMVGPNRTVLAPTASRASSSPPLMPPSGPTTMMMRSGWAEDAG